MDGLLKYIISFSTSLIQSIITVFFNSQSRRRSRITISSLLTAPRTTAETGSWSFQTKFRRDLQPPQTYWNFRKFIFPFFTQTTQYPHWWLCFVEKQLTDGFFKPQVIFAHVCRKKEFLAKFLSTQFRKLVKLRFFISFQSGLFEDFSVVTAESLKKSELIYCLERFYHFVIPNNIAISLY